MSSDRATDNDKARGPFALRWRFETLRATPLRAHAVRGIMPPYPMSSYRVILRGWLSCLTLSVPPLDT